MKLKVVFLFLSIIFELSDAKKKTIKNKYHKKHRGVPSLPEAGVPSA